MCRLFYLLLCVAPFASSAQRVVRFIHVRQPAGSIQRAVDTARTGDHIIVHRGIYRETVTLRSSGVTLSAAKGEEVVIFGGGGIQAEHGINDITIEGLVLRHIITPPASMDGEQPGAIATSGGVRWNIRHNTIDGASGTAISIGVNGRPQTESRPNHPAYSDLCSDITEVGHHHITGNRLVHCGQAGIFGLLHGSGTVIDSNEIEGVGSTGIRLAVAIDVVIRNNTIRCDTGIFLGPIYQGARISTNKIVSMREAVHLFDSHGPLLIDHNTMTGAVAMVGAEANVFVNNRQKGPVHSDTLPMRPWATSSYLPHSLVIKQTIPVLPLENRWDGNTKGIFPLTKQAIEDSEGQAIDFGGTAHDDSDYVAWPMNRVSPPAHAQPFVHPGLLHSAVDIQRIREALAKQREPWKQGFAALAADVASSAEYVPHPAAHVERSLLAGMGKNIGDLERDGNAAYQNALMYCITGEEAHARKAVGILNGWSSTLKVLDGTDVELGAGICGLKFANAAELMRWSYPAWKPSDIDRCRAMLRNLFYPPCQYFAMWAHGNWDLACMKAMMAIGIFCDDHALFDRAVDYFYHGPGNGSLIHYIVTDSGQVQESGRDQQHTQLGVGQLAEVCQMAWNQGLDLYGADDSRLLRGFEYVARYNLGEEVPFVPYKDVSQRFPASHISDQGRGRLRNIYEMVFNHYRAVGLPASRFKYTRMAAEKIRPEGAGFGADHPGFGTLLFSVTTN